jgi:hypothetical protein
MLLRKHQNEVFLSISVTYLVSQIICKLSRWIWSLASHDVMIRFLHGGGIKYHHIWQSMDMNIHGMIKLSGMPWFNHVLQMWMCAVELHLNAISVLWIIKVMLFVPGYLQAQIQ